MPNAAKTAQPFITLVPDKSGFQVLFWTRGVTRDLSSLPHGEEGGNLQQFLNRVGEKLFELQPNLNEEYLQIDRSASRVPKNIQLTRRFNGVGSWAYAMACEIDPHQRELQGIPRNFLYRDFIYPLEEVYTKTFAMAHVFGGEDESAVGLRGLLTDFRCFGAINPDGGPGHGLSIAVRAHIRAYFEPPHEKEVILYQRFGALNHAIFTLVVNHYPRVVRPLAKTWRFWREHQFVAKETTPARDEMLNQWDGLISELERK